MLSYAHQMFLRGSDLHRLMRPSESHLRKSLLDMGQGPDLYALTPMPAWPRPAVTSGVVDALRDLRSPSDTLLHSTMRWESALAGPSVDPAMDRGTRGTQLLVSEELRLAQELHDRSLQHLHMAKQIAGNTASFPSTPTKGLAQMASPERPKVESPSSGSSKKTRRKWLPPLGPPTKDVKTKLAAKGFDVANCEWLHTNPEAFASLSKQQSPSPPK